MAQVWSEKGHPTGLAAEEIWATRPYYGGARFESTPYLNFSGDSNRVDGWTHDASGNLLDDSVNRYLYDAEGRLCAVDQYFLNMGMTGYLYSSDGNRLAKGTISSFSCDMTANGFTTTNAYVEGPHGEQVEETDGNLIMLHFNAFLGERLLATYTGTNYSQSNWHYALNDWLGTKRVIANSDGTISTSFASGPFGDGFTTIGSGPDPSEQHFTGKERDTESNLDYFGARYYNSNMGRFMSPDDFGGHLEDPQTLNKYAYVGNNPLSRTDPTGHDFWQSCDKASSTCGNQQIGTDSNGNAINHFLQATTNSTGNFSATVITSASLSDPNSGNSAIVNGTGVQITSSTGTAQGIFINGTPSADIQGDPNAAGWNQFSFHIDSNYAQRGVLSAGTATYLGDGGKQGMLDAIKALRVNGHGPFTYPEEMLGNPYHPGATNLRFSTGDHPDLFNYGPSPHFAAPQAPGDTSNFHVDNMTGPSHIPCAMAGVGCY